MNVEQVLRALSGFTLFVNEDFLREKACGVRDLRSALGRQLSVLFASLHLPRRDHQDLDVAKHLRRNAPLLPSSPSAAVVLASYQRRQKFRVEPATLCIVVVRCRRSILPYKLFPETGVQQTLSNGRSLGLQSRWNGNVSVKRG